MTSLSTVRRDPKQGIRKQSKKIDDNLDGCGSWLYVYLFFLVSLSLLSFFFPFSLFLKLCIMLYSVFIIILIYSVEGVLQVLFIEEVLK